MDKGSRCFEFNPPNWCSLKYNTIAEAILGAAEMINADIYCGMSLTFRLDDFEIVDEFVKKHSKKVFLGKIVEMCKGEM